MLDQIAAIAQALSAVLEPEGYLPELTIESLTETLAIKQQTDDGVIPVAVHQLSDGVRAAFGLVADIAFRCAKLNPHFGASAALRTHGIVLIDEVDLHLHPSWQQKILNTLQLAFPNIQFIVTTHSPQVLSAIPKECVRSLDAGGSVMPEAETQGVESQDIPARVFATPPAPEDDEWARKLNEYAAVEALGRADEHRDLYQDLARHFGPDYPPLRRIEIHRKFVAAKNRAGEGRA